MALLAVACGTTTGKNGDEVGSTVPDSLRRTLQFITDLGINPDTLMMPECINYPVFADTVLHSHWLTADEAVTLGMQVLCGVDADGTPAQLMGIHPVSQEVTLLMFQVYYGDHSPVVLATYDKDGVIVDLMNAGSHRLIISLMEQKFLEPIMPPMTTRLTPSRASSHCSSAPLTRRMWLQSLLSNANSRKSPGRRYRTRR